MKKLLLFVLLAALFPFTRMQAEITRASQLFGTWQFTGTITLTEAGQEYADLFSDNCEVTISAGTTYALAITNFAGAAKINANFNEASGTTNANIRFMNPSALWGTGTNISTSDTEYSYTNYRIYIDPDNDTEIEVTDVNIVSAYYDSSIGEWGEYVQTILGTITNAKLTLIEKAYVEITDLSGDWHFTPTKSQEDSEFPTEFDFNLAANNGSFDPYSVNDGSCAYFTATISFEGYDPVVIDDAAFDGYQLDIPFNDTYIDEANKIAFYVYNSTSREGSITFNKASDISLTLKGGMQIAQEVVIDDVDSIVSVQYYTDGSAAKQVDSYDFSGTYHITASSIFYVGDEFADYPETFDMVITYNSAVSKYYITSFFGNDTQTLDQGGIPAVATTTTDGSNVLKIATGDTRKVARLETDDDSYQYHVLHDGVGNTDSITLTVSYDGTITMSDFTLLHMDYGSSADASLMILFSGLTVTKEGEPEPFNFTGTYTATCLSTDLEVLNDELGYGYPTEFEVVISDYNESTGKYYIYTFLNEDGTYSLNYGGIPMVASDDNSDVLIVTTDKYIKSVVSGQTYMKLRDVDGGSNTITLTANEDGTLTLGDFSVYIFDYDVEGYIAAIYHNVTLTKASDAVKSISAPAKNEAKVYAAAGTIYVIGGEPTYIEVYNAAGVQVYAGIASEVSGLARGIYYVRAGQTVTPVIL